MDAPATSRSGGSVRSSSSSSGSSSSGSCSSSSSGTTSTSSSSTGGFAEGVGSSKAGEQRNAEGEHPPEDPELEFGKEMRTERNKRKSAEEDGKNM